MKKLATILFNLNCLTKPIIVKGYNGGLPFVPANELLKKVFGNETFYSNSYKSDYNDLIMIGKQKNRECDYILVYHGNFFTASIDRFPKNASPISYKSTECDLDLFDLLNRWKIDYRNLIGQGLAIDVETLK